MTSCVAGAGLFLQDHGEPERGALAFLALDPDLAAHHLGQLLGDGKPQARAPVPARDRGVHLGEGLEQPVQAGLSGCRSRYRLRKRTVTACPSLLSTVTRMWTSPSSVNLMAFPIRLIRICRSLPGSPRTRERDVRMDQAGELQPLVVRPAWPACRSRPPRWCADRSRGPPDPAVRPRSWRNPGCR